MNANLFRLVFSSVRGMWVPVWEGARAGGRGGARQKTKRAVLQVGAGALLLTLSAAHAELPVPCGGTCGVNGNLSWIGNGSARILPTEVTATGSRLPIYQESQRAILNWQSFNIGAGNEVEFRQDFGAAAATLNRIYQGSASEILGNIKASGQVYLINQNGIIFGNGAQVNTSSLVASALNISDDDFDKGGIYSQVTGVQPVFSWEEGGVEYAASFIRVDAGAKLAASPGGVVMVLAPKVENYGSISAPGGQAVLAAGAKVYLSLLSDIEVSGLPQDSALKGFAGLLVEVDPHASGLGGEVINGNGQKDGLGNLIGQITAERGNITLAGLAVNQRGRITATTSVRQKGSIMLLAADTKASGVSERTAIPLGQRTGALTLGKGSITEVLPELNDPVTSLDEQDFNPSSVDVVGKTIDMQENAAIVAPGGRVNLAAQQSTLFQPSGSLANDSRIYMAPGSRIDVAGTAGVSVPVERNFIEVELRGNELKDSPLQRDSFIRGKKVWIDIRKGTPLADVSGYTSRVGRSVAERTAEGGKVSLKSEGDIVMRENAVIDVSGGGLHYQDGYGKTTQLVSSQGQVYDIGDAPPDIIYGGFASFTRESRKWGVVETWDVFGRDSTLTRFAPGYYEGRNAGSVEFFAQGGLALDGTLTGKAAAGVYQRQSGVVPLGGRLTLTLGEDGQTGGMDVLFSMQKNLLPADFSFDEFTATGLPEGFKDSMALAPGFLREGGFNRVALYSNGRIEVPHGVSLDLAPGSWPNADKDKYVDGIEKASLTLVGRRLDILGDINVPAGKIVLGTRQVADALSQYRQEDFRVNIGADSRITARGLWVNDSPWVTQAAGTDPVLTNGGSISVTSFSDVALSPGSVLDVSGGGWVQANNRLKVGNAGSISLKSGSFGAGARLGSTLFLDGELRGYALSSGNALGKGGTLTLGASSVRIGGAPSGTAGELFLAPALFQSGGFRDYSITGTEGVTVSGGTEIVPLAESLVLSPGFLTRGSGGDIYSFSQRQVLPPEQRIPGKFSLAASSPVWGGITVEENARVLTGPQGEIALNAGSQITVLGVLEAPAGKVSLGIQNYSAIESFESNRFVWLGASSRLLAGGFAKVQTNDQGIIQGEVLQGGDISFDIQTKGYLVAEAGSVMDVSGVSAALDIPRQQGAEADYHSTQVSGDAGSITIKAPNILLDGVLKGAAPAGDHARAGLLEIVAIDSAVSPDSIVSPVLVMKEDGALIPNGLTPGQDIDARMLDPDASHLKDKSFLTAKSVRDGGFDQITLTSSGRVEFEGDVSLALRRSIQLDAPVIAAADGARVNLAANYVALGNSVPSLQAVRASSGGSGTLDVTARQIDLTGNIALRGFGAVNLVSKGDIRLKGMLQRDGFLARTLEGSLTTGGNLTLQADQIYPTTLSQFSLAIKDNPAGVLSILSGDTPSPVLSAGGKLSVSAPNIVQQGVLKAPFGEIALQAEDTLTLGDGSVTSVSAEGQIIPFGKTDLSGSEYTYALGVRNLVLDAPPEKRVRLDGKTVNVTENAVIDVSGGGDLYAYEFIPGPGGSKDVLDAANAGDTFAILPGLTSGFAPYDHQYYLGNKGIKPGDSVYLSGVEGLPAGVYSLMPARYGLLPGAFLVKPVSGYQDMSASQQVRQPDGTMIVSGYRASANLDGSLAQDARTSGFAVRPGTAARVQSEYLDTRASELFANQEGVQLPGDAGNLSIAAIQSLTLDGALKGDHAAGRNGAAVDITAARLAVVGAGADLSGLEGFMQLDASRLNRLGAASLLLGGTRSLTEKGVEVRVGAQQVVVANTPDSALSGPEILLVATDEVKVKAGSVVEGKGAYSGTPKDITIGFKITDTNNDSIIDNADAHRGDVNRDGVIDAQDNIDGNGALLRVASSGQVAVGRDNVDRSHGDLVVESGAVLRADQSIILDASRDNRSVGRIELGDNGALSVGAQRISLGDTDQVQEGLVFSGARLASLHNLGSLTLRSYSTVDVYGGADIGGGALKNLSIEAAGLGGYLNAGQTATLRAETVSLSNPNGSVFSNAPALSDGSVPSLGSGSLHIAAQWGLLGKDQKIADNNDAMTHAIKGFGGGVKFAAAQEIMAEGNGSLEVEGDLTLEATRITAAPDTGGARQSIAASGVLNLTQAGTVTDPGQVTALGGYLNFTAKSITHQGRIDLPAGVVSFTANGADATDNVTLAAGSQVNAGGFAKNFNDVTAYAPAGSVKLISEHGDVNVNAGAVVDVSGTEGSDAGQVRVSAAQGQARLAGTVKGSAGNGSRSGVFTLDAGKVENFTALNDSLNAGGFGAARTIRVRNGDIAVAEIDILKAHQVKLVADEGRIEVQGKVDASGNAGGTIGLYAKQDVILTKGALDASATEDGNEGGKVTLATTEGQVIIGAEAKINVSGGSNAQGGTVLLRAPRVDSNGDGKDDDVAVAAVAGTLTGAGEVVVEAVKLYDASTLSVTGKTVTGGNFNVTTTGANATVFKDTNSFITDNKMNILARLGNPAIRLRPGVEVRSSDDLVLAADWDLFKWRFDNEPGVLTLRAPGDLKLNKALSDGFDGVAANKALKGGDSWSYRLVAGADQASADPLAVLASAQLTENGDIKLADKTIVRTGTGAIDIAAGRDVLLDGAASVIYTAGVPGPVLADFTSPRISTLTGTIAEYPTGGGDIAIHAQCDIKAAPSTQTITDWLFRQGSLNSDGTLATTRATNSNHRQPTWWTQFSQFKQGIGALGGGDIAITAAGDIDNLSAVIPTNGRLAGVNKSIPDPSKLVVQGGGNLDVTAGGDIRSGIFYVARGLGEIKAGGALGSAGTASNGAPLYTLLALGEGGYEVTSGGELVVQHVFNPTVQPQTGANLSGVGGKDKRSYFFTYDENSQVALTSLQGDVKLVNAEATIYPGTLLAAALQGDITLGGGLNLFPAPQGNLTLLAAGSVALGRITSMSDVAPERLPSAVRPADNLNGVNLVSNPSEQGFEYHAPTLLHRNDAEPVRIYAQTGSIIGGTNNPLGLLLPKAALLQAGLDISNVGLVGQNLHDTDVTRLEAGRDVVFSIARGTDGRIEGDNNAITVGGPGWVEVIAGRDVDLGSSAGIVTKGNLFNPYLTEQGASVLVWAGAAGGMGGAEFIANYIAPRGAATGGRDYVPALAGYMRALSGDPSLGEDAALAQFKALPPESQLEFINRVFFAELKSAGRAAADPASPDYRNYSHGREAIAILFPVEGGAADRDAGDIKLYFSQIKTEQGGDIELLAPGGLVNAGLASATGLTKAAAELGVVTVGGGSVRAFARNDFLVNQSRVFTLAGGDILIWSDKGNIDAGKGSKTASATPPPKRRVDREKGKISFDISGSVAGSGIGVLLTKEGITPGDVDLVAPEGEVNAGDAGIRAAGNLNIAALRVVGADNIQVGGVSTGVPVADTGGLGGSLSGVSNLGGESKIADQVTEDMNKQATSSLKDTFKPSFLTVEVIGHGD